MGYRRFDDASGRSWEVVVRGRQWRFEPIDDNPGPAREAESPSYEKDPFELSVEELTRLLGQAQAPRAAPKKSPFLE
jgi:hypothetical protein